MDRDALMPPEVMLPMNPEHPPYSEKQPSNRGRPRALRTWEHLGRPSRSRYGISALDHPDRQHVWLDDPNG